MLPKIRYCEMSLHYNYFDWIDLKDQNQCEWAKRYLVKNQFSIDSHKPLDTQLVFYKITLDHEKNEDGMESEGKSQQE